MLMVIVLRSKNLAEIGGSAVYDRGNQGFRFNLLPSSASIYNASGFSMDILEGVMLKYMICNHP